MTRNLTTLARIGMTVTGALLVPTLVSAQGGFGTPGQQNRVPDPNAKRVMVTAFRSLTPGANAKEQLGVQAADALRSRLNSDFPFKQVYVLQKTEINSYLEASGFSTTEALAAHDARALASLVRADEYLVGTVSRTPAGFKVEANLVLARDNALQQPLGSYEAPKMDGAMQLLSKELKEARKQLEFEQKCVNSARDKKFDAALGFAKEGVLAYPKATLARICQMNVMIEQKASNNDIMAISREIVKIDPRSRPGLARLAEAYRAANMQDSAVLTLTALLATDPANPRLQKDVVEAIAQMANPRIARPIIDSAVVLNPGEPDLLRLRWLILLAVRDFKEAYAQGEELVKLDTSFADTTYFIKTATAQQNDSAYQKAAETSAKGLAKFPGQPTLTYMQIVTLKQAGQNQQALEALDKADAAKIPVENGGFVRATLLKDLNRPDEVIPALKKLISAGDTSTTLRQMLVQLGNEKLQAGQKSNNEEDYKAAMSTLVYADSVVKGDLKLQTQFLIGAVNVTYGNLKYQQGVAQKSCALVKEAKNMFADAQIMLPRGGTTYVDAMRTLMGAVMQLDPAADAAIKQLCK